MTPQEAMPLELPTGRPPKKDGAKKAAVKKWPAKWRRRRRIAAAAKMVRTKKTGPKHEDGTTRRIQ
jgi:hypothetical protein